MLWLLATPTPNPTIVAQSAASTVVWWTTPLVAAVAALIGAFIAFGSTAVSDRRKRFADDERQWHRDVLESA